MEKNVAILKWALFAGGVAGLMYWLIPFLIAAAFATFAVVTAGLLLVAVWFFFPAICEWFAQASMLMWEKAVRAAPIQRLRRDLQGLGGEIQQVEQSIGASTAAVSDAKDTIRSNKTNMDPDQLAAWEESVVLMEEALQEMRDVRDEMVVKYQKFEVVIMKAETDEKIGSAIAKANKSFTFGKKVGVESTGSKVALDEIQRKLSESRATMQTMLSRKKPKQPPTSAPTLAAPSTPFTVDAVVKEVVPASKSGLIG